MAKLRVFFINHLLNGHEGDQPQLIVVLLQIYQQKLLGCVQTIIWLLSKSLV